MDNKDTKDYDHEEDIYYHYSEDQVAAMKENIELYIATQNKRKSFRNKGLSGLFFKPIFALKPWDRDGHIE